MGLGKKVSDRRERVRNAVRCKRLRLLSCTLSSSRPAVVNILVLENTLPERPPPYTLMSSTKFYADFKVEFGKSVPCRIY